MVIETGRSGWSGLVTRIRYKTFIYNFSENCVLLSQDRRRWLESSSPINDWEFLYQMRELVLRYISLHAVDHERNRIHINSNNISTN